MSARKPPVGTHVRARGHEYVLVRYPVANLDVLEGMVLARRVDQKRAVRLDLEEIEQLDR